jgi:hypothetical protein
MAVIFPILSTFDAAGVNKAQRAFKGLSGVAKVGTIAFAALGAASLKYGADAVTAAAADQKAQLKLAKTLENVTGATEGAIAATEQFITAQQFATGVSDSQLRPALETLVRATGDVTKAQNLLKLGLDVSAGSGRDLESISLALAKAQGGQFTALQRLGIVIPDNIKKSKDFGKVQEYLNDLFGGQAAVAANTYEGKLAILRERLGEVQESLGGALIPTLTGFADKIIKNVMPSLEGFINGLVGQTSVSSSFSQSQQAAYNWGQNVRAVIQTVVNYSKQLLIFGAALVGIWAVAKVVAAAGAIVKVIQAIIKVYQVLQTTAILAATAMAFASGGTSVIAGAAGAAAAAGAIALAFVGVNKVLDTYTQKVEGLPQIVVPPDGVLANQYKDVTLASIPGATSGATGTATGTATTNTNKLTTAVVGLSKAGKAAQKQMAQLGTALARNNEILANAKQAYADFKTGVSTVISGIIDFGAAATAETGTFLENLTKQATKAADFGAKVKQLLAMGLSQTAIGQVLAAGADAGTKIADEIIAGGATVVDQVNTLITATQSVADSVGTSAATQFYQAGITAGQSLVDGVKAAIAANGFTINASGQIVNTKAIEAVAAKLKQYKGAKSTGGSKITDAERKVITDLANSLGVEVPKMAAGGIVTKPTLALIGEAGAEAVVPLSGRHAQSMGNTINLTVNAGMGADGTAIGREIVDIIKRYERVSGPVFASA